MIAEDLVVAFEPWLTSDLQDYLETIGAMFDEVELYSADVDDLFPGDDVFPGDALFPGESVNGDTAEGWTILLDPDRCPAGALPYLAQYVGERLPVGIGEAAAREWIKDAPNQRRGTPQSIFQAAQRRLLGSRIVAMYERGGGNVDHLTIITQTAETPDPAAVLADLRSVVPADIVLTYTAVDGQIWESVDANFATWQAVKDNYPTWNDVAVDQAGATVYSRPAP